MRHPPYCDYCGEVIHNYHKVKRGQDIDVALNTKIIEKSIKGMKSKILMWIVVIGISPMLDYNRGWCFCNQQHKDKFAKRIGLKIKVRI